MMVKFIDGTDKNSGQRLDNVNWTDLVLASGKLVLQKEIKCSNFCNITAAVTVMVHCVAYFSEIG